ncbi:MAG: hypothetical protein H6525_05360 [Actinobacteria bacterium]|nr:hypothetical protein [Actinomycetota bacterium]
MSHGGRSVVVFSPRGGTGTTTLAIALATWLAGLRPGHNSVALLDFHLPFGNLAAMLGLAPAFTLGGADQHWTPADIGRVFTPTSLGCNVVASPNDPLVAESVTVLECASALAFASAHHDLMVVDIGSNLNEATLLALESATALVMVVNGDPQALPAAAAARATLGLLGIPVDDIVLVANRVGSVHQLDSGTIGRALGHRAIYEVPDSPDVALAVKKGRSLMRDWPDHPWSVAVGRIGELCLGNDVSGLPALPRDGRRSWLGRRTRRRGHQPIGPPTVAIGRP